MFTSRAEHRLILRQDNADKRLLNYGYELGLISKEQFKKFLEKQDKIEHWMDKIKKTRYQQVPMDQYLRRSEVRFRDVLEHLGETLEDRDLENRIEIEVKYSGYVEREEGMINRMKQYEAKKIPSNFLFKEVRGLSREAQEKLDRVKPASFAQASRISGITPCDLSLLAVYLEKRRRS